MSYRTTGRLPHTCIISEISDLQYLLQKASIYYDISKIIITSHGDMGLNNLFLEKSYHHCTTIPLRKTVILDRNLSFI